MDLVQIVVILVFIGTFLFVIESVLKISPPIKALIQVVVVLFTCLWLLGVIVGAPYRYLPWR